jgi:hypothetical protein
LAIVAAGFQVFMRLTCHLEGMGPPRFIAHRHVTDELISSTVDAWLAQRDDEPNGGTDLATIVARAALGERIQ